MNRILHASDLSKGDQLAVAPGVYLEVLDLEFSGGVVRLDLAGRAFTTLKGADAPVAIREHQTTEGHAAALLAQVAS